MPSESVDNLCYGLILLQEIAQGYDNGSYRRRAIKALTHSSHPELRQDLTIWSAGGMDTVKLIEKIEEVIINAPE